jgi:hypothetical protein
VKSQQAGKEVVVTPASDKEEISLDAGVSGAKPYEQAYDAGNLQQPESAEGGDFVDAETSVSAAPEAESPASPPAPEQAADPETAPRKEGSDETDQALPEEPVASQEKTEDADTEKNDTDIEKKINREWQR